MRSMTGVSIAVGFLANALLAGTGGIALWLWSTDTLTVGAVATAIGLAMRITNMSYWILFVPTGVSENVGVVEVGMEVISRPPPVLDRPGATGLQVERGAVRYERVGSPSGPGMPVGQDPVPPMAHRTRG